MPLTDDQRDKLHKAVDACRCEIKTAVAERMQAVYGIHVKDGLVEDESALALPDEEAHAFRLRLLTHLAHWRAQDPQLGSTEAGKRAVERLIREASFTHLNRFCAYKMLAARKVIDDPIGKGLDSRGFKFYLADHPKREAEFREGRQERAYRLFLDWQAAQLEPEMQALFALDDPAAGLYPSQLVLDRIFASLNDPELQPVWQEDEAIGWVYQFFTTDDERRSLRKASAAPQNSYEMAVRNQFFTPRYIVAFLTDNSLGRTWIEMRQGNTALTEQCAYLLREAPEAPPREIKDPREIRALDSACGSGHFLLYAFDLFLTIYDEAYEDPEAGQGLRLTYPDREEFVRAVPALILEHNLWGVDIDRRAAQIAGFALAMRAQRAWHEMGVARDERPQVTKCRIVCAEPMPGEKDLFDEFAAGLDSPHLAELVQRVFEQMRHADTLGSLLKIETDLRDAIADLKRRAENQGKSAVQMSLDVEQARPVVVQHSLDLASLPDETFFATAEKQVLEALQSYARKAVGTGEQETIGLARRLFAHDAEQGFAFVDLCHRKFDVVLMNPPFGDAATPSKAYIEETYGDTKGDVYKAFIECYQDRLVPGGYLGAITSRTGFFLGQSADWRKRVVLRLYRPLVMADLGMGVLDAMVETAAYVLRSLTEEERPALTLSLAEQLGGVKTDQSGRFTRAGYQKEFDLKRHQAEQEIGWLVTDGFVLRLPGEISARTGKPGPVRYQAKAGVIQSAIRPPAAPSTFFTCLRLLADKTNDSMRQAMEEVLADPADKRHFTVNPEEFKVVPGQPFAYWVSNNVRRLFMSLPPLESNERVARQGGITGDDERWLRACWEVSPKERAKDTVAWVPFAKGGQALLYYTDFPVLVHWDYTRGTFYGFAGLKHRPSEKPASADWYFQPGIVWPLRSGRYAPAVFPKQCIFSPRGQVIITARDDLDKTLGLCCSMPFDFILKIMMGRFGFPEFQCGVVQKAPYPSLASTYGEELGHLARNCVGIKRGCDTVSETSHVFQRPAQLAVSGETLEDRAEAWEARVTEADGRLAANQREIDDIVFHLYGIEGDDRRAIEESLNLTPTGTASSASTQGDGSKEVSEDEDAEDEGGEGTRRDRRTLAEELISYAVGCAFGRFDIRLGAGLREPEPLPDPFAPLPVCSPGMLTGPDGLPCDPPEGYPLGVAVGGILVEDADESGTARHPDDIVARVRAALAVLFGDRTDAIEAEACQWLEVPNLREYFRRPGAGGFWQDHIKRYSKSRRKAPIYWLLQSSKRAYSLWIYIHKLDKDTLFRALIQYAQPALKRERDAQDALRLKVAALPMASRERRQAERDLERQEAIVGEMTAFCENLREVAEMRLVPDLNDGVVLTIAPLHKLVPWKEATEYWKALCAGKYPWASIAQQLVPGVENTRQ